MWPPPDGPLSVDRGNRDQSAKSTADLSTRTKASGGPALARTFEVDSTVRYVGIEVNDAIEIAEKSDTMPLTRSIRIRMWWAALTESPAPSVVYMDIEQASAKICAKGVINDDEDYVLPIYAELIPIRLALGAPEACPRLLGGVTRPAT